MRDVAFIQLYRRSTPVDKFAIVDAGDFEIVRPYVWHPFGNKPPLHCYAATHIYDDDAKKTRPMTMGRLLLGLDHTDDLIVHYRDGNGLNCRRSNLWVCESKDLKGYRKHAETALKYKGLHRRKFDGRWRYRANLFHSKGRVAFTKYFDSEEEAAAAYNELATQIHGEFAVLNQAR